MSETNRGYRYMVLLLVGGCLVAFLVTQSILNYDTDTVKIPKSDAQTGSGSGWSSNFYKQFGIKLYSLEADETTTTTIVTRFSQTTEVVAEKVSEKENGSKYLQSLPDTPYILGGKGFPTFLNSSCAIFPNLDRLHFNNDYWQMERTELVTYYLLNAYLDVRELNPFAPEVRILAMVDVNPEMQEQCEKSFCHLWYLNQSAPVIVPVRECRHFWPDSWGTNSRYVGRLISCPLQSESDLKMLPTSVSFVQNACDNATNNLRVVFQNRNDNSPPGNFGVCVKGLDFLEERDKPLRLVEWIEFLELMGVEKIFLYEFATHPKIKKVLDYYAHLGRIDVTPLTLPGTLPNEKHLRNFYIQDKKHITEKRKNEVITYNDCLYRNMYRYDFLALLDTDEILVPMQDKNWKDLFNRAGIMKALHDNVTSTFCFRQLHFFGDLTDPEISPNFPMLQHVYRDKNITRPTAALKCIHRTDRTQTLHNHLPFSCLQNCTVYRLNPDEEGRMQHYRATTKVDDFLNDSTSECRGMEWEECTDYLTSVDKTLWKWKELLIPRVESVLKELQLI